MNDELLNNNQANLNISGFNDDSMISEAEYDQNNNYFLKSTKSLKGQINIININENGNNDPIFSPDGIIQNKTNNISDISNNTFEDLFTNVYAIPMNRPSKYSISKKGYKFIYESTSKTTNFKIDSRKFGISKNSEIITYLLSLYIFSEFLNLDELQNKKNFKVIFMKKQKTQNRFIIDNIKAILNNLEISQDKANDFEMFINGINKFLTEDEYLNIQKKNKKKMISIIIFILLLILLIIGIATSMVFSILNIKENEDEDEKEDRINSLVVLVLESIVFILFIIGLIIKIIDAKNLKLLYLYYELRYLIVNYNRVYEYIEKWNNNLFDKYKIRASMPISLNYIMFNLNPYQEIEIKHLDMNWAKKKFYKNQKDLFKSQKDLILFNTIKQNMSQRNSYSTSIN